MPAKFSPLHAGLFTAPELAEYLAEALAELEMNASAGCENAIPGSEMVCGDCASCVARELLDKIDAETDRRLAGSVGPTPPAPKLSGMIDPPAPTRLLAALREAVRNTRSKGIAVRLGALGLVAAGRDGWELAPHGDGVNPIGAAIFDAQATGLVGPEQAACFALGCDLATLEGIADGLEKKEPSGAWGRSVAKDNYCGGFVAGAQLRFDLLAPSGALRVAS